jgi:hypothetical protein
MALLQLQILDIEDNLHTVEGIYNGQIIHDLSTVSHLTLDRILILVQIVSGVLYANGFQDYPKKLHYIFQVLESSNNRILIPIGGDLKVSDYQTVCNANKILTDKIKQDIDQCFQNVHNSSSCLLTLSDNVHRIENQLLTCDPVKREHLSNLLDLSLLRYIEQTKIGRKCETDVCLKILERNNEISSISNFKRQLGK